MPSKHHNTRNEIWKPVVGYENCYEASNLGRVRATYAVRGHAWGRILKPQLKRNGYLALMLSCRQEVRNKYVHLLVLEAFRGQRPSGHEVNHKDGNKTNNHIQNLEWCTKQQNHRHRTHVLKRGVGENHPHAKLVASDIPHIRNRLAIGETCKSVASDHGVCPEAIWRIKANLSWKHVP